MNTKIVIENRLLPFDFFNSVEELILDAILFYKSSVIIDIDLEFVDGSSCGFYDQSKLNIKSILVELMEYELFNLEIRQMTIVIKPNLM